MPRELPYVQKNMLEVVPGLGTLAMESVGNTAHTTGVFIYIQNEGDAFPIPGIIGFHLTITDEFEFEWHCDGVRNKWRAEPPFTDSHTAAAVEIITTYAQRDPISFMFHSLSAAEMEITTHRRAKEGFESQRKICLDMRSGILKSPRGAEWVEKRLAWALNGLDTFARDTAPRVERLEGLVKSIRSWTGRDEKTHKVEILDVMQSALNGTPQSFKQSAISIPF